MPCFGAPPIHNGIRITLNDYRMNRNSPVPLWAVLGIGVVLVGGIYIVGQRAAVQPKASVIVGQHTLAKAPHPAAPPTASVATSLSSVTSVAGGNNEVTGSPVAGDNTSSSSTPCSGSWNLETGSGEWSWKSNNDPARWSTYTDAEDFFSIQYPDLGNFDVEYSPRIRGATLKWKGAPCFRVEIHLLDTFGNPDGLSVDQWLAEHSVTSATDEAITIDGMKGMVQYSLQCGAVGVDLSGIKLR